MKKKINELQVSLWWVLGGLIALIAFVFIWIAQRFRKTIDTYYRCPHGAVSNDIYFMLKACDKCRSALQANGYRLDAFIDEYTNECKARYKQGVKH